MSFLSIIPVNPKDYWSQFVIVPHGSTPPEGLTFAFTNHFEIGYLDGKDFTRFTDKSVSSERRFPNEPIRAAYDCYFKREVKK